MGRHRPSRLHSLILLALALIAAERTTRADATARAPAIAILGVEPIDLPETLAQQLTSALRQRAAGTSGIHVIPGKDFVEIKMVFGCDAESPSCLAQAGKTLGADKLVYGTIRRTGRTQNVTVTLRLLDVRTAGVETFLNETVQKRELAAGNVNSAAARWFATLVAVETRPVLTVTSDPSGAALTIDGEPSGRTPVTLRDLPPGSHALSLSAPGHRTTTRTVELRAGSTHEVTVPLEAAGEARTEATRPPAPTRVVPREEPAHPAPRAREEERAPASHPGRVAKGVALASALLSVAAGAVAIYTWRTYSNLETVTYQELMAIKPASPSPEQVAFFQSPTCSPPKSLGASPQLDRYVSDCQRGETHAAATTAMWVVAGGLAVTSVISFIVGERQSARGRERRQAIRLSPLLGGGAAGILASGRF